MNPVNWLECDVEEVRPSRLLWWEGSPYDPAGYYLEVEFQGSRHQMFLAFRDDKPTKGKSNGKK